MIQLWIKGDTESAQAGAAKYNVEITEAKHRPKLLGFGLETVAFTSDDMHDNVAKWFADAPLMAFGYGYPDGTLLHYKL